MNTLATDARAFTSDAASGLTQPSTTRRHRRFGGLISNLIVPDEDDRDTLMTAVLQQGQTDIFFRHLRIRPDGGLNKDNVGKRLFTKTRMVQASTTVVFALFNLYTVIGNLCGTLAKKSEDDIGLPVLIDYSSHDAAHQFWMLELAVSAGETFIMLAIVIYSLWVCFKYCWIATDEALMHYRLWHQMYSVCCILIPKMTNFSAMNAVQHLNPQILFSDLALHMVQVEEGHSPLRVLSCFILWRLSFGVLGFVAFSIKFCVVHHHLRLLVSAQEYGMNALLSEVVLLFGFINQAFGITRVSTVETTRLFLFIFGGEDAAMQAGELDRQETYLACITHFVFTKLYLDECPRKRRFKRMVAMLSFTHLDIQSLVLDEDESREADADTFRTGA
eukprot:gnl/TRDRNA2_/TRDRNA2_48356_c0_seq1.p1 gnl/TRDRNA2_/TRDRNA2_48356_c0~~gnl/TRDRNA2_/TRDRNA2_48356_c0_seq1.p1  ORF type:complete len:389 (+),score=48.70 gnl/TRDRNA2_/TRDRNA2_48356_c0_seq1:84-1250(+)